MSRNIYGVYFICCINNYLEVVEEQMSVLEKGLLDATKILIIFITNYNPKDEPLHNLLSRFDKNQKIVLVTTPENLYEKFAVNNYKRYIPDVDYLVYYFHTKGIKPPNDPLLHIFRSRRQLLNYYTLEKYIINIQLLENYDAVGCSLHLYPKKHFSGNFWWSKSSYVNTLCDINDKYLSPEMYILSNDACKYISLANNTNTILIENYPFKNDEELLSSVTSDIIVIEEHKELLHLCE